MSTSTSHERDGQVGAALSRSRRRRALKFAIALAVCVALLLAVVDLLMPLVAKHQISGLLDDDAFAIPLDHPAVVCAGAVTPTCASEAAERAGVTVAWLPDSEELGSRAFVAHTARDGVNGGVWQELDGNDVSITLFTEPVAHSTALNKSGSVSRGGTTVDVHSNGSEQVDLVWEKDGNRYMLSALTFTIARDQQELAMASAVKAFEATEYASRVAR